MVTTQGPPDDDLVLSTEPTTTTTAGDHDYSEHSTQAPQNGTTTDNPVDRDYYNSDHSEETVEYSYWEYRKRFNMLETLFMDKVVDIGGPDGGNQAIYGNELHASYEYVRWLCRKYQGLLACCDVL